MSATSPEPDDLSELERLDELVLDEDFVRGGRTEASADERIAKAQRIARENARLRRAGEIADGSGKPAFRMRKRGVWLIAAAVTAGAIVLIALLAR